MTWTDVVNAVKEVRPFAGFVFLFCGVGFQWWAIETGKSRLRDIARKQERLEHLAQVEVTLFRAMEAKRNEAYMALAAVCEHWNTHPGDPGLALIAVANGAGVALSRATKAWQVHLEHAYGVAPAPDAAETPGDSETDAASDAPQPPATVDLETHVDPSEVPEQER